MNQKDQENIRYKKEFVNLPEGLEKLDALYFLPYVRDQEEYQKLIDDPDKLKEAIDKIAEDALNSPCTYFYLREDISIHSQAIIESYGKRLKELMENGLDGRKTTGKEIADLCSISSQAVSKIVNGKNDSINIRYCNIIANHFGCSAFYLLGLTQKKNGFILNGEVVIAPFRRLNPQESFQAIQAGQWAMKDPALFDMLEKLFKLNEEKRNVIKEVIEKFI